MIPIQSGSKQLWGSGEESFDFGGKATERENCENAKEAGLRQKEKLRASRAGRCLGIKSASKDRYAYNKNVFAQNSIVSSLTAVKRISAWPASM